MGDLDMDWSDKSEVTLARIVGDISLYGSSQQEPPANLPYPLIVRFGLLVTEDTDRVYIPIDLWDPESLEEFEWMWLSEQIIPSEIFSFSEASGNSLSAGSVTTHLDVGVKRRLGKKDSLVLYSQIKLMAPSPAGYTVNARYTYQLRCVMT